MASALFTLTRRTFLDDEGRVVGDKDPRKLTLIGNAGGVIPMAKAQALGLAGADGAALDGAYDAQDGAHAAESDARPAANVERVRGGGRAQQSARNASRTGARAGARTAAVQEPEERATGDRVEPMGGSGGPDRVIPMAGSSGVLDGAGKMRDDNHDGVPDTRAVSDPKDGTKG